MRQLMARQKKILDNWYKQHREELHQKGGGLWFDIATCDFFSCELLSKIEAINDTEILYQEINRYISDKVMAEKGGIV